MFVKPPTDFASPRVRRQHAIRGEFVELGFAHLAKFRRSFEETALPPNTLFERSILIGQRIDFSGSHSQCFCCLATPARLLGACQSGFYQAPNSL